MSVLAYVILLHKNFKRECMKINKIRSKLNLLKKFAYKNNSTCVCVVCVLLSVTLSLRDHSRSLKKQLAEDLLNSRPGSFFSFSLIFFFFFGRRERPTRRRRSFPSWYTKYIKTNVFSNCDSYLIHFKIKAKRIVS